MNTASKSFLCVTAAYLLGGGAAALAMTQGAEEAGQAPTGVAMENRGTDGRLEGQSRSGVHPSSIKVAGEDEQTLAAAAKIGSAQAATIAEKAHPGSVVETKLGTEDGFLVWKVDLIGAENAETQIKIDAGDGRVLASRMGQEDGDRENDEQGESDEGAGHQGWKSSEDDDNDQGKDD